MSRTHNIVGCEATDPARRLIDFCHAHGSLVMFRRTRRHRLSVNAVVFGLWLALAAATLILMGPHS